MVIAIDHPSGWPPRARRLQGDSPAAPTPTARKAAADATLRNPGVRSTGAADHPYLKVSVHQRGRRIRSVLRSHLAALADGATIGLGYGFSFDANADSDEDGPPISKRNDMSHINLHVTTSVIRTHKSDMTTEI